MSDTNTKRTSFGLTPENSATLKRLSERTGENYSVIINNLISIFAGNDNEGFTEILIQSIERSYKELLDKASKETDVSKAMKEYGPDMRRLEMLKKMLT